MPANKVVILRHGESEFNKSNLFCGWHDAPLTRKGKTSKKQQQQKLKERKNIKCRNKTK